MRDTYRRYRAIHQSLRHVLPTHARGQREQHRTPLAAVIGGSVGAHHPPLPTRASMAPGVRATPARRITRCTRWVEHERMTAAGSVLPCAPAVVASVAAE